MNVNAVLGIAGEVCDWQDLYQLRAKLLDWGKISALRDPFRIAPNGSPRTPDYFAPELIASTGHTNAVDTRSHHGMLEPFFKERESLRRITHFDSKAH